MKRFVLAAVAGVALAGMSMGAPGAAMAEDGYAEGDVAAGERIFRRCMACHAVGEGAKNKVGPQLNGVVGRQMGSVEGYRYSKALLEKAEEVGVWTEEALFGYLEDPSGWLGGRGKMAQKFAKVDDRNNVIAYLKTYAEDGTKSE